jgi:hypothetical protein
MRKEPRQGQRKKRLWSRSCGFLEDPSYRRALTRAPCERYVKQLSDSTFRGFSPSVITRRSRHIGMTGETLHRSEIRSGVEKMGDECPAKVVRRKSLYPGFGCSLPENVKHSLIRHAARDHPTRLIDRAKKCSGALTSSLVPSQPSSATLASFVA